MRIAAVLLFVAHFVAAQDMLVVAPEEFHDALTKWRAHKSAAGLRIAVEVPADDVAEQVRAAHKKSEGSLRFVMLVGDTDQIPCDYVMANAIAPHERDPRIATDAKIADLDGDGLPNLAIGRIPAQTPEQAARLLARSVAYETNTDTSEWRRRVNLVAGVGGFGAMQDFAIEYVTRLLLKDHIPAQYEVSLTYANAIFGKEILDAVFASQAKTLGEIVMLAKRRLVKPDSTDERRAVLESLAATFYKPLDPRARAVERAEHVWLYNLFGDPSLVIPRPVAATVECSGVRPRRRHTRRSSHRPVGRASAHRVDSAA